MTQQAECSLLNRERAALTEMVCISTLGRVGTSNAKVLQGTLDMLILKALMHGEMHGYGIAKRIQQLARDVLVVEEGSLYPALQRLQLQGWIESEWGVSDNNQRARFYNLTREGRKQLEVEEANWERLSAAVTRVMRSA